MVISLNPMNIIFDTMIRIYNIKQTWGKHVKKWVELRRQIQNRKDENANPREKLVQGSLCPVPALPQDFPTVCGSSFAVAAACWSTCCISRLSRWPAVVGATSPLLDGGPRAGRGRACYRCPVALPRTPASGRATGGWEPLSPRRRGWRTPQTEARHWRRS